MMKQILTSVFLFLLIQQSVLAQKEIISATTEFIKQHKYQQANQYLDSILKKNPKRVDALMMKGNVILNYGLDTTKAMQFVSADDESVFFAGVNEKPKLLLKKTVFAVQKIWKKCLRLDSTRTDIRKGLCTIYAMALMKDSLKNEMVRLAETEKEDSEQAFKLGEYARKFKERNRFDEAMELYKFIAELFPSVAGIRCDIAEEYFYAGKINETLLWLDSCYQFKTIDETSFLNGAFTYSNLGFFDDAQSVLTAYSRVYTRKMGGFYYGLMLFSDSSKRYFDVLNEFCNTVDSNSYFTEVSVARKLLCFRDSFSLNDYKTLADDKDIPDYYKVLIHQRALRQFKNNCEPFLIFGVMQSGLKNYSSAVQFLEEGDNCKMQPEQTEYWMLHYAYSLFMFGEKEKAFAYFKLLYNSSNVFMEQAAKYFTAKILLEKKKQADAGKLLKEIISSKSKTKYVELAKVLK